MNGFSVGISKVYNALVSDCSCNQLSAFPRSWQKMKRNAFVQCVHIAVETMLWIWGLNPRNCSHNQNAQRRNYCSLYYYTKIKLPTWLATRWKPIRKQKLKIWSQTSQKYWHHLTERMICKHLNLEQPASWLRLQQHWYKANTVLTYVRKSDDNVSQNGMQMCWKLKNTLSVCEVILNVKKLKWDICIQQIWIELHCVPERWQCNSRA